MDVAFGATRVSSHVYHIWSSFPLPGEYYVVLYLEAVVPRAMVMNLDGLDKPLELRVVEVEDILSVKVRLRGWGWGEGG